MSSKKWTILSTILSIIFFILGFFASQFYVRISGNNNITTVGKDSEVFGDQCEKFEAQTMVNIDTVINNISGGNIDALDQNDREFFETIKTVYGCRQDNGIRCEPRFLNIWNPFEGEVLKNVVMSMKFGENRYDIFIDYLTNNPHTIGVCDASDSTKCSVFPRYLLQNNEDKLKNTEYYIVSEDGVVIEACETRNN